MVHTIKNTVEHYQTESNVAGRLNVFIDDIKKEDVSHVIDSNYEYCDRIEFGESDTVNGALKRCSELFHTDINARKKTFLALMMTVCIVF